MKWPAGLTNSDKEWLLDSLELATSPLEETDGTTVQASDVRGMQEEVSAHWPTWDGVSKLPKWLAEGLGEYNQGIYVIYWQEWHTCYAESRYSPSKFANCLAVEGALNQLEEQARERFWADTPRGEPELRGVHGVREDVRERQVVRQSSKQREVYTYRNWASTVRRDVV